MAKEMICTKCGYQGKPKTYTPGSAATELILWLFLLLPGLLYSIWRVSKRYDGCPQCKADNMIPADSPMARQLRKNLDS